MLECKQFLTASNLQNITIVLKVTSLVSQVHSLSKHDLFVALFIKIMVIGGKQRDLFSLTKYKQCCRKTLKFTLRYYQQDMIS